MIKFFQRALSGEIKLGPPIPDHHRWITHDPPFTLSQKQRIFTRLIAELIRYAYRNGLELTFSEAYRTPTQALRNFKKGVGIKNSLHGKRLAVDFNLFKNGKYQRTTKAHKLLGEYWESLSTPGLECCWGGSIRRWKSLQYQT